jgi:hypothetical protein
MSVHAAFRRQPVPGQMALQYQTVTLPAPIRGIVEVENWAYTKPGSASFLDNWFPTQKGIRLRGGTEVWATLPAPVEVVRSGFEYVTGTLERMFAATDTRIFDVTFAGSPILQTGVGTITNGNFSAAQLTNASNQAFLLAVNDANDFIRRYDGTAWAYMNAAYTPPGGAPSKILMPDGTTTASGMTYVWKYRNRLFFIKGGSMDAYCLPVNAVGGTLIAIPLSGAAKRGGSLLFGCSWSIDAGDGIDDKCVFVTTEGEFLVFTGTDPTSVANWRQEGRYDLSKPLGKNGHQQLAGDVLVITVDGVVPLSAAMQKDVSALSLAAVTYNIENTWMKEFRDKNIYPWTIAKWDEADMLLVNHPGGNTYDTKTVSVSNLHTGAWSRFVGWDAMCFLKNKGNLFFGTQDGRIIQAESTGYDNAVFTGGAFTGDTYACTMVGGWEMFQAPPNTVTWFQARAAFFSAAREPFEPLLAATTDYEFRLPPPPNPGPDPGLLDLWDQGLWDDAKWDQPAPAAPPVRNTMWVSIGETGFSHAPICMVTIGQQAKPNVELLSIAATYNRMGVNV